jgi:hypothetical protein
MHLCTVCLSDGNIVQEALDDRGDSAYEFQSTMSMIVERYVTNCFNTEGSCAEKETC